MPTTVSCFRFRHLVAATALTGLAACGGGGDAAPTTATTPPNTLDVSVTADNASVSLESGAHHVGNLSLVKLVCAKACTFAKGTNNGVTITQEATTGTEWTARLGFASDASSLTVKADAADGSTATVVLKPKVVVAGTATWSMDSLNWSRISSTQGPPRASTAGSRGGLK